MNKTFVWMLLLLGINWGGFIWLIVRTLKKERRNHIDEPS